MSHKASLDSAVSPEDADFEDDALSPTNQGNATPDASGSRKSDSGPTQQKRRRVTRACDECRRKKIKCDGKQPCTHCVVYSYDCTYDQPSNRRRNPAPQYVEALEIRLRRAEALLRTYNPNVDLSDSSLDALVLQQGSSSIEMLKAQVAQQKYIKPENVAIPLSEQQHDTDLHSMFEGTGDLDLDDRGHYDFHGGSSGIMFLRRMREQFGGILGTSVDKTLLPVALSPQPLVLPSTESPRSHCASPHETGLPNTYDLPEREVAIVLCNATLTRACSLLSIVHASSFYESLNKIYDTPPESFSDEEHRFLPLLYQVMAVGCMFADDDIGEITSGDNAIHSSTEQGMKFFNNARSMIDITDCRDLSALQCIIFMIMFLQATSNLSTCYSYIGVALRSALRLGLHRNISHNFTPIEAECRKRTFWTIRKMDTYVSAMLGFPRMLYDEDIDADMPIEVDDIYITKSAVLTQPPDKISLSAACNQHTKLMYVLAKVIQFIYPTKGIEQATRKESSSTYSISHNKIREIENDLQEWLDALPMELRPGGDADPDMTRSQQLLRLAYAHVQMMLYRPFLHYVSPNVNSGKTVNDRSYACAAASVSVARNIVHITSELKKRGLLVGAYWFTMYTTFFAILSLVYFVLENPTKEGAHEILSDALAGKAALEGLARRSLAASKCSRSLKTLFDRLPENLKQQTAEPAGPKKKRPAPAPTAAQTTVAQAQARSAPSVGHATPGAPSTITSAKHPQRAVTYPDHHKPVLNPQQPPFHPQQYKPNVAENIANIRRSWQDQMTPKPLPHATTSVPERSDTNTLPPQHFAHFQAPPQLEQPSTIPDLSHMMFPSSDPFAYPNQPLIELDHRDEEAAHHSHVKMEHNSLYDHANNASNTSLSQPMYMGNNLSGYDAIEGQLFGPLPPYIMQAQGNMGVAAGGINLGSHGTYAPMDGVQSFTPQAGSFVGVNNALNFNDIFVDNEDDWTGMAHGYRPG